MNCTINNLKPFGVLIEPNEINQKLTSIRINDLKHVIQESSLILFRGFAPLDNDQDLILYGEHWGEISQWPFGKILQLKQHENPQDHIFDHHYVPLHWDGMYRPTVPEFQIFHCSSASRQSEGGKTVFTHTPMILNSISIETRKKWDKVIGNYSRKMEFYNSKTVAPLITKHPFRDVEVIRYCEPPAKSDHDFINHPSFHFQGIKEEDTDDFFNEMNQHLYNPQNFYAHEWEKGDVVITDNYTLLHGREPLKVALQDI